MTSHETATHPVSVAIPSRLKRKRINAAKINDCKSFPDKDTGGTFNGATVRCADTRWLSAEDHPQIGSLFVKSRTGFYVANDNHILAAFGLFDAIRPDSLAVVTELRKRDIAVSIISSDDTGTIEAIAVKLGMDARNVKSQCSLADK